MNRPILAAILFLVVSTTCRAQNGVPFTAVQYYSATATPNATKTVTFTTRARHILVLNLGPGDAYVNMTGGGLLDSTNGMLVSSGCGYGELVFSDAITITPTSASLLPVLRVRAKQ